MDDDGVEHAHYTHRGRVGGSRPEAASKSEYGIASLQKKGRSFGLFACLLACMQWHMSTTVVISTMGSLSQATPTVNSTDPES